MERASASIEAPARSGHSYGLIAVAANPTHEVGQLEHAERVRVFEAVGVNGSVFEFIDDSTHLYYFLSFFY